jgi:hypothetical protein
LIQSFRECPGCHSRKPYASRPASPGSMSPANDRQDKLFYIGMAGERRGQGIQGRMRIYMTGKAGVSGLGEAVLDRALADLAWLDRMTRRTRTEGPLRAKQWAQAALTRADLELTLTITPDRASARITEQRLAAATRGSGTAGADWYRRVLE